ncbi:MAG TPA: S9 family peptidase [Candidatus Polarisedimenticolaceae bacterium]|nr:S9 family peptidase [Candidatus Polarisedimenticolaceae bacterium]
MLRTSALILLLALSPARAEDVHPTAIDVARLRAASDPAISADGRLAAYVVQEPKLDPDAKPKDGDTTAGWSKKARVYVVPTAGGAPKAMTWEADSISGLTFSPDGRSLAFLRKEGDKTRLRVLPLDGGEARMVDTGKLEPGSLAFTPDGSRIAFLAQTPETDDEKAAKFKSGGAEHYGHEWKPSHLWTVPLEGGEAAQAFRGPQHVVEYAFSPNGKRLALVLAPSSDPYDASNLLRPAIADVSGDVARFLDDKPANLQGIAWSPDGKKVAWMKGVETLSLLNDLVVADPDGLGRTNAAAKLDPTLQSFAWRGDSSSLVALVGEKTRSRLVLLAADGSRVRDLAVPPDRVLNPIVADKTASRLVTLSSTFTEPANPSSYDVEAQKLSVLADVNPEAASWPHGTIEVVTWKSPEGATIEGVLTTSPSVTSGTKPPLIVMPHGGPDSMTTVGFSIWTSYFGARGYSVFRPNYRGSTAYGHDFYAANRGRLGPIEFMDIESGVDALIKSGKADASRLFYGGWSWGGYLTVWTIGHTTRYRAAVAGAAVVDTVFQYVTSDINHGIAAEWEFKGNPWKQLDHFDASSPMRSLGKVATPTLVIHGESDDRVPFANGRMLYRAISDIGGEVEFYAYPREPHGFREKAHIVDFLTRWAEWYKAHDETHGP